MATINLVMHIMVPILTLIAGLFIGICIGVCILGPIMIGEQYSKPRIGKIDQIERKNND